MSAFGCKGGHLPLSNLADNKGSSRGYLARKTHQELAEILAAQKTDESPRGVL
jgi:hypothetical protein